MTRIAVRCLKWGFAIAGVALALFVYKNLVDASDVEIRRIEVGGSVGAALDGTTALVLSDIHVRGQYARENRVIRTIERERPDFVLIAGDLRPYGGPAEPSIEFFERIRVPGGAFAVLGDAEYRKDTRSCIYCHKPGAWEVRDDLPVRVLRDQVVTLRGPRGAADLWASDVTSHPDDLSWIKATPEGRPVIALTHFPESAVEFAAAGADLVLSGDTHGGQALAPHLIHRLLIGSERARYLYGPYRVGDADLYVSKGLGWTHLPIRIGVRPEIVILEFTASAPPWPDRAPGTP
ncbi:metallophosphoesterase [bacterium]|nr:metallophosphoesterase [bacterium]